jgi:hypothetical protein
MEVAVQTGERQPQVHKLIAAEDIAGRFKMLT